MTINYCYNNLNDFESLPIHFYGAESLHRLSAPPYNLEILDALCYIFKGERIKVGDSYPVIYFFRDGLLGPQFVKYSTIPPRPSDHFSFYLKDYPKEFELVYENYKKPSSSEVKKSKCERNSCNEILYRKNINYYVIVPAQYSTKKYNELENKFASHTKLIDDMILNSGLVNCFGQTEKGAERLCFSVMKSGIFLRCGNLTEDNFQKPEMLCRFWDYGMEELPNRIDATVAFTTTLINQFFQLYPIQPGYDSRVNCTMNFCGERRTGSNLRECYVNIWLGKPETPVVESKPEGLNKW